MNYKNINPVILIPAYKPDEKLINVVKELIDKGEKVLIVNDGSGSDFEMIFNTVKSMGCTVLNHDTNKGKGRALKTGFQYCIENNLSAITADADGQHLPKDIINIAKILDENPDKMILGVRHFDDTTPMRSLIGNTITRKIFKLLNNGNEITDTQTGLRGFSIDMIKKIIDIEGERYEFEMNMLLELKHRNIEVIQEPISVVYINDNESSHYNTLLDSLRVYKRIFLYALSSTSSGLLDYGCFCLMAFFGVNTILAVYIARAISSLFNYSLNRKYVFENDNHIVKTMFKYYILVIIVAGLSGFFTNWVSTNLNINIYFAKAMVDLCLYVVSYNGQKYVVFK
ncbi:bifunctional glycosyltransferase family 2/GtrA family protein [Anaerofustis sp.]|uniref:bifunctional glycosyltransferase family 2/GtrA family protein n=1 Tax=Anaerofustis sp. TaxID=1872517 RepID=UPI0025C714DA|nr:bifunctional glycosyltransferase family 2/GtrA family protein [Anaerofustis sp.]